MRSNQQHLFSHVPTAQIPRSTFNRSHGYKTTFDAGLLIPFYVDEALPGDTFKVNLSAFARLATPIVPFMDNLFLDVFFFAVPNRLLWTNWQKFMGEQYAPGDSIDYLIPQVTAPAAGFAALSMADYFGLPLGANNCAPSALPFRAYNLIWNEWFRDENLQPSVTVYRTDGPDSLIAEPSLYNLRRRGKRHDYFTSCLPWPQKGPGVNLPLGTYAPVKPGSVAGGPGITYPTFRVLGDTADSAAFAVGPGPGNKAVDVALTAASAAPYTLQWGTSSTSSPGLIADLSAATAATINTLRQAFQIQKLLERDARGGTRYTEILRSHFGVVSPDARLQRPEFLGGGTAPVNINPVAQTSSTDATTPQGNLAAFGTTSARGIGFTKSFVEHCTILGLMQVRADLSYQQGMDRMWSRRTRYDFYWPAFSHLGEQAVLNKEIYYSNAAMADDAVFGYQERWAEYRYFPSKITGKFRSTDPTPLDMWHLAQKFTAPPALNDAFIQDTPPIARVIAVTTEPHFLFDSLITIQAARPMPTYSVPGFIDHF